jgi:hypothetical protein
MILDVGTIRSDYNGFNSIAELAETARKLQFDEAELNFATCNFFEANMVAPLYVVIAKLRDRLNDVTINNVPPAIERILKKNQFFTVFNMGPLTDTNQTTLPFKIFEYQAVGQFNDYLVTYLRGRGIPSMSTALTKRFRQSLFEIFLNASIHSESTFGIFVCGQFFPQKNRLDLTIADAGIGIRDRVRKFTGWDQLSSCAAIKWALIEGHTTKPGNHPGGLGLKLIKDFIRMNQGKLQIVSRFGYHEFFGSRDTVSKLTYDFPGTIVNIEINTQDTNTYCLKSELSSNDIF